MESQLDGTVPAYREGIQGGWEGGTHQAHGQHSCRCWCLGGRGGTEPPEKGSQACCREDGISSWVFYAHVETSRRCRQTRNQNSSNFYLHGVCVKAVLVSTPEALTPRLFLLRFFDSCFTKSLSAIHFLSLGGPRTVEGHQYERRRLSTVPIMDVAGAC